MKVTEKLRERFCKDMNIPIKVFVEPYFTERLDLYDTWFNTKEKWKLFLEVLSDFQTEQDYFSYYNSVKDKAINYLNSVEAMQRFMFEDDYKSWKIVNEGFPKNDIFKESFVGRHFISIDMKKANFTSLKHYDRSIVGEKETYEDFIGMFTEYEYLKKSKYIRQVIFGNCNPKRQVSYEKKLMDEVLSDLLTVLSRDRVVYFSTDEIVLDVTHYADLDILLKYIANLLITKELSGINLTSELFELDKIPNTSVYVKKFLDEEGLEFKCLDSFLAPFVFRKYLGQDYLESDYMFMFEGRLAKFIDTPQVEKV